MEIQQCFVLCSPRGGRLLVTVTQGWPWAGGAAGPRAGSPAWEAAAVSSILTTKYFLLVNIPLMTNNVNFICFGQLFFLKPALLYIYVYVGANTRSLQIFLLRPPPSKRITGWKEGETGKINNIHILDWSEEQQDTELTAVCC